MTTDQLPTPHGICGLCQNIGGRRNHFPTGAAFMYCPHNLTGGLFEPGVGRGGRWNLFTPITAEDFEDFKLNYSAFFAEQ